MKRLMKINTLLIASALALTSCVCAVPASEESIQTEGMTMENIPEGLVLQDVAIWKDFLGKDILPRSNASELYFEEKDIERFVRKLEDLYPGTVYVNRLMTHSWGQRIVRFYDPDGNLIEVGTPM